MSDIYERLKSLFGKTGIDVINDSVEENAEFSAIVYVLEKVYASLSADAAMLFDAEDEDCIRKRCELTGLQPDMFEDGGALAAKIFTLYSNEFGTFDGADLDEMLERLGLDSVLDAYLLSVTASGDLIEYLDIPLRHIGMVFEQYLPPFADALSDRMGLDFDGWDSKDYRFADIDRFNLTYNFLETL